jgi:hypothetical protein
MAVIRNSLQQLRQTVLPDIMQWLGPVAIFKFTDSTIFFDFPLDDGTRVKSEWLLIPLDSPEDVKRLLSLQLTYVWLAEFRELDYSICAAAMGRVGRYPSVSVKPTSFGLIGESNPFSEGSDWYENLVLKLPSEWAFFKQPGGLSAEAENRENLPPRYYERLGEGHSEEWKKVHIHGDYGDDLSGQAVFKASFNKAAHVTNNELVVSAFRPLMIGMDFGRTPTALITQVDVQGRLLVFEEITSVDMGLNNFLSTKLKPVLLGQRYVGIMCFVVADPAGRDKGQLHEESLFDCLASHGFLAYPAPTNDIGKRLSAVERLFLERRGEHPTAILIDGKGCPLLVRSLQHDYKYARKKDNSLDDKPEKKHPASDLADCLQYAALGTAINATGRIIARFTKKERTGPRIVAASWT